MSASAVAATAPLIAKLSLAGPARTVPEDEADRLHARYCAPASRLWSPDLCAALDARRCEAGTCSYRHFGNCSAVLLGGGWLLTAAHCLAPLVDDPELRAASAVLLEEGGTIRRLALGEVRLGKTDFSHDWVAMDDEDPVDVAAVAVATAPPTPPRLAPVPDDGTIVFVHGFPRAEDRATATLEGHGYTRVFGTPAVSFGRVADRNAADRPLCAVDEHQEHWELRAPCPAGVIGSPEKPAWRGPIFRSPFLASYDVINGYSGAPVFDAQARLVGINITLIGSVNPQERYDTQTRAVAIPALRAVQRLGLAEAVLPVR